MLERKGAKSNSMMEGFAWWPKVMFGSRSLAYEKGRTRDSRGVLFCELGALHLHINLSLLYPLLRLLLHANVFNMTFG